MSKIRVEKYLILSLGILLIFILGTGGLASLLSEWPNITMPFEVEEPIAILDYTSDLSLFPGETKYINITVENQASLSYNVTFDFQLSDSAYQATYVEFSNEVYTIEPGEHTLTAWIKASLSAPAKTCSLTISLKRNGNTLNNSLLIAYWPLNGTVEDFSGYENHGEIRGDPEWVEGKIGKALEFDGIDDFVFVKDSDSLDITDTLTLMAWVRPADIPFSGERKVVYKGDAYIMKVMNRRISCDVNVNGWIGTLYDAQVTPLGEWYHVAVVYDGAAEILYVDGVEVDRRYRAGQITVTSKHLGIGAIQKDHSSSPYDFFEGTIDEIKIYNYAFNANEIRDEMTRAPKETGAHTEVLEWPTSITFGGITGSSTNNIALSLANTGSVDIFLNSCKVNGASKIFGGTIPVKLATSGAEQSQTLVISNVGWNAGYTYEIRFVTTAGTEFAKTYTATQQTTKIIPAPPKDTELATFGSMWIKPSTIVLSTENPEHRVGYRFNVTVWVNLTLQSSSWEFAMLYNKTHLKATGCNYTGSTCPTCPKSQFFANVSSWPFNAILRDYNATHGYVLYAELTANSQVRNPGHGSLAWVEFEVIAEPPISETLTSLISISTLYPAETYVQDDTRQGKVPLNTYDCSYSFSDA